PNFCFQISTAQGRTKIVPDEIALLFSRPVAGWIKPLWIFFFGAINPRFILNRDRVDRNSFGLVCLNETNKVARVSRVKLRQEFAADHRTARFHPTWRTPRRRKK